MSANNKLAAALHPHPGYPCGCGEEHRSAIEVMYCEADQAADDRAARRTGKRDTRPERYYLSED